jgi:hypothetical protein
MQMTNRIIIKLTITGLLLFSILPVFSQLTNTLFFMKGVPQIYQINPAFQPGCRFFLGLPVLSSSQIRIQSQPLKLDDIIYPNPTAPGLITFLDSLGDKDAFLNALNKRNYINADVSIPLASFGFGKEDWFIGFDVVQRISSVVSFPYDFAKLLIKGPGEDMHFDFNGLSSNITAYDEFALSISKKINDMITVGARGKILFGLANISTSQFDATLSTSEEVWNVHSDIGMNASLPFLDVVYDADGNIDFEKTEVVPDLNKKIPRLMFNPKNFGLAMDLGVDVFPIEKLQLSASIVDFGSIKWKDDPINLESHGDFEFNGVEINLQDYDPWTELLDSLSEKFKFVTTSEPYRTWLPTKVYLGASYYVHPKISFGLLSRTEIYKKDLRQQFTFSSNFFPFRMLSAAISYSIIEGSYNNLGLGLALNAFPFNLYVVTDTGASAYFFPTNTKFVNIRFGMNLVFGCGKKQKYDLPLVN